MIDLSGRHVLVTGGSRGIGAACCRAFARAGATVAVQYHRNLEAATATLAAARGAGGGEHFVSQADLRRREGVTGLFEAVAKRWGRLDCLVNNAGIWLANPLTGLDEESLRETWRLNVEAPVVAASQALGWLVDSEDGNIVNVSSTAGQRGEARYSPYAASKAALIALTKSWAVELAPDIRVNAVAPGWVDTDLVAPVLAGEGRAEIEATIPLGRIASCDDIAGCVVFLASDLARHVTGEILNVNGGAVLCG